MEDKCLLHKKLPCLPHHPCIFSPHVSVDPSTKSIDTMPDDQVGKLHTRYEKGKDDANIGEGSTAAVRRAGECVRANR